MSSWRTSGFFAPWCVHFALLWLSLVSVFSTNSQQYVTFVSFTNTWRYNQAGQDLGTNWVAPDYDDTGDPWQSGPALLAVEDFLGGNYNVATLVPNTIPTRLSLTSAGGTNGTNITFYFRTKFTNTLLNLTGVELWATNLVDDGCVIYLNGTRVGNVRLTNANPSYLTLANSSPASEGQFDNFKLPESMLAPGENSLAVEVHQSAIISVDIAFAIQLAAIISTPLVITSQPPDTVAAYVGSSLTLTVGVAGSPAHYQWQRNGVNIAGAASASFLVPTTATNQSGEYRCVITNSLSVLTSATTTVLVVPDLSGPHPLQARVLETGATNIIQVLFDENLLSFANSPNRDTNNYRLLASGTTDRFLSITNALVSGASAILRVDSASNWTIGGNYYLILNNLVDIRSNVIPPNTIVPISWPHRFDLLEPDAVWTFHAAAIFDSAVYAEAWTAPDYVEGPWWAEGPGIFYGGPSVVPQCLGPAQTLVGHQPEPIFFRTIFQWPADLGSNAQMTVTRALDDGLVLYLNGQEIQRINVTGPIDAFTRSSTNVPNATCQSNSTVTVTNLWPGTNWLAAAVVQSSAAFEADVVFGLQMRATVYLPSPVPDSPPPVLQLSSLGTNAFRLSWTGYGYALESTTDLGLGSESYPSGPWIPVASMSNPHTNSFTNAQRFFRLRK